MALGIRGPHGPPMAPYPQPDLSNKQVGPMGRTGGQHPYGFLAGNVIASPRDDSQLIAATAPHAPN